MRSNPIEARARRMRLAVHALNKVVCLRDPLGQKVEVDCTPTQLHAIAALADGPMSMSELGKILGATGPTITGIVDRLEKQGVVERHRDASDRRVVNLHLTEAGQALGQQFEQHIEARLTTMLGLLDEGDQKTLVELFEKLADRVTALVPEKEKAHAPR